MKKKVLIGLGLFFSLGTAKGQFLPFNKVIAIDLDTTATVNGVNGKYYESPQTTSANIVSQFFPFEKTAYKLRAISYATDAQFSLASGQLKIKNSLANTVAKATVFNIQNAGAIAKFSFTLDFTNFTSANSNAFIIAFGNVANGSTLTSSSAPFTTATTDIFGAFRVIKSAGNLITQYKPANGTGQTNTAQYLIAINAINTVEIFANTTNAAAVYTYNSGSVNISANTYHVYVGGVRHAEEFPKVGTSYVEPTINALSFTLAGANNPTSGVQETVGISNLSITYPSVTDPTLPVSLTSFTGKLNNNAVDLKWSTSSEQNNSHFDILRSSDAKSFTLLDRVEGNRNVNETKEYTYQDKNPFSGTNYYQLKQVDLDGKETIMDRMVAVKTTLNGSAFTVFINQENQLNASIFSESKTNAVIAVFDLSGNELVNDKIELEKGNNTFVKHLPFLAKGVYVLRLTAEGNTKSIKFIK